MSAADRPVPRPHRPIMVSPTGTDRFFRDIVGSMRNGVIAITRDGHIAVMNDVACHALHVGVRPTNIGGHYADVLHGAPEVIRILNAAFEAEHLPNRAELRLKSTGRVIGYTLSLIRGEDGEVSGATLFFKDLTRVEQLEERERLRDRLAALGEMAAAIAHEVKNPLAGIEVMAGLLRRRLAGQTEAQATLTDIINEVKMANAIVVEVLDFVRPIRLQVEPVPVARVLHDAVHGAEAMVPRRGTALRVDVPTRCPPSTAIPASCAVVHQSGVERLRGPGRPRHGHADGAVRAGRRRPGRRRPGLDADRRGRRRRRRHRDPRRPPGPHLQPVLHDQAARLRPRPRHRPQDRRAHDGRISVASPPSGGARFRVVLPLSGLPDPYESRCPRTAAPPAGRAGADDTDDTHEYETVMGRILIADDHDSLRRGLARGLTEAGHDVDEAPNGNAAIEKLHEAPSTSCSAT